MDASPIELGAELRRLRYQRGLTQRQVAQRLGGHFRERDIQRIEAGQAGRLPPHHLQALLRVFGNDLQCFLSHRTPGANALSSGASTAGSLPWSEGSMLRDFIRARDRLHLAVQSSQNACERSKELLQASGELTGPWTARSSEAPNTGTVTSGL